MEDFNRYRKIGDKGEVLFYQLLRKEFPDAKLLLHENSHKGDIQVLRNGKEQWYDVKYCNSISRCGQLIFLIKIRGKRDGWFLTLSPSTLIAYGDYNLNQFYLFRLADLREFVKENPSKVETFTKENLDNHLVVKLRDVENLALKIY